MAGQEDAAGDMGLNSLVYPLLQYSTSILPTLLLPFSQETSCIDCPDQARQAWNCQNQHPLCFDNVLKNMITWELRVLYEWNRAHRVGFGRNSKLEMDHHLAWLVTRYMALYSPHWEMQQYTNPAQTIFRPPEQSERSYHLCYYLSCQSQTHRSYSYTIFQFVIVHGGAIRKIIADTS